MSAKRQPKPPADKPKKRAQLDGPKKLPKIANPRTAWSLFSNEHRQRVRNENPGISFGRVSTMLSEMWNKSISEEERAKYVALAAADKIRYTNELAQLSEEDRAALAKSAKDKKLAKNKKKRDENKPKRPRTAFTYYVSEERPQFVKDHPEADFKEIGKLMGAAWKRLSEEDRSKYEKMAEGDKERYTREMHSYKARLVQEAAAAADAAKAMGAN